VRPAIARVVLERLATREEPAREPALVEPARAVVGEEDGRSRGDVGGEARGCCDGHLVPARPGRTPCPRIDEVMLLDAATHPAPRRLAARGETSRGKPDGTAAGHCNDDLAARREIAARRDEASLRQEAEGVVDDEALDDAVEVEERAAGTRYEKWLCTCGVAPPEGAIDPNESNPPKSSPSRNESFSAEVLWSAAVDLAEEAEDVDPGWLAHARPPMATNAAAAVTPSFCFTASARRFASAILEGCGFVMETEERRHLSAV